MKIINWLKAITVLTSNKNDASDILYKNHK